MKRLALCLDGTWNTVRSQTNVSRLCEIIAKKDDEGTEQLVYYDEGVGTKPLQWLRGGALGYGLGKNVIEAYEWLVKKFVDEDEIFIFGFSRGAYTARSLAGMVAKCGLLRPGVALSARTLFKRYQLSAEVRPIYELEWVQSQGGALSKEETTLLECSRRIPIKMIGVWDTVGSLGIPFGDIPGLSRRSFQFYHTRLSNLYEHAYHALAIDEHREAFEPTLWTRFVPKIPDAPSGGARREPEVEQRWFVGAHADVGGGNRTSLPAIPLAWLAGKASDAGLKLTRVPHPSAEEALGPVTDSFRSFMFGLYRLFKRGRRFIRTIEARRVEKEQGWVETVAETIDSSVFERVRADGTYRPEALIRWARVRNLDLRSLNGAIDASTGRALSG